MDHQKVLQKLLNKGSSAVSEKKREDSSLLVESYLRPEKAMVRKKALVGRPVVEEKLKARNFTVCMAHNYLQFLDAFKPPFKKIQGRGRKLRFIIDEFIRMSKRQKGQLKFLQEALGNLQSVLSSFSATVKKGEKLELSSKEKQLISLHVNRVQLLTQILCFTPQELKKILPLQDWNLYSFALNWKNK